MASDAIRMDMVYSILKCIRGMLRLGRLKPLRRTIMLVQKILQEGQASQKVCLTPACVSLAQVKKVCQIPQSCRLATVLIPR